MQRGSFLWMQSGRSKRGFPAWTRSKKADMVVGNLLQDGFGTPDNTVFVADASGREERWAHLSKTDVAWRLLSWLLSR